MWVLPCQGWGNLGVSSLKGNRPRQTNTLQQELRRKILPQEILFSVVLRKCWNFEDTAGAQRWLRRGGAPLGRTQLWCVKVFYWYCTSWSQCYSIVLSCSGLQNVHRYSILNKTRLKKVSTPLYSKILVFQRHWAPKTPVSKLWYYKISSCSSIHDGSTKIQFLPWLVK